MSSQCPLVAMRSLISSPTTLVTGSCIAIGDFTVTSAILSGGQTNPVARQLRIYFPTERSRNFQNRWKWQDIAEIGVGNSNISSVVHICIPVFGNYYQRKYGQISWKRVQFFFQYRFWKLLKALRTHLPAVKWPFSDISIFNEVNNSNDLFLPCAGFKSFVQEIFCWVFINLFARRI